MKCKKITLRDCNNLLKKKGVSENTEATRKGNNFYVLHICSNNVPVPLFIGKSAVELLKYINSQY